MSRKQNHGAAREMDGLSKSAGAVSAFRSESELVKTDWGGRHDSTARVGAMLFSSKNGKEPRCYSPPSSDKLQAPSSTCERTYPYVSTDKSRFLQPRCS